jgi:hypothetical protein
MRQLRRGELSLKDMTTTRENDPTRAQAERTHYDVRDLSLQHRVKIYRNLNEDADRDRIFKLTVDDYEVILDAEEIDRITRWI